MIVQTGDIATRVDVTGPSDAPALRAGAFDRHQRRDSGPTRRRGYRVVCPDFRGHGGTGVTSGPFTMEMLAADIAALCAALDIETAHIAGLSLGGLVAQELALGRPDLVASLILCDTGLRLTPAAMWHERAAKVRVDGVASLGPGVVDRWITPAFARTESGKQLGDILLATDPEGYAGAAEAIATADFTATASRISVPTLVIVGAEDEATPLPLAQALTDVIAGARLHVIPATRHIPSIEPARSRRRDPGFSGGAGLIDKFIASFEAAVADVRDGSTGADRRLRLRRPAGSAGIEALADQGARDLVIVANNAGTGGRGLARLLALGRVRRIVCSFPRSAGSTVFEELFDQGRIELELVPQGTLAERLRAAGAGVPAFFTPTAFGTRLADGKETRIIDGKGVVLETALHGDRGADRGLARRPLGQPRLPRQRAQLQSRDGDGSTDDDHRGARQGRTRVDRSRRGDDARDLRRPAGPCIGRRVVRGGLMDSVAFKPLSRLQMTARVAREIEEGWVVNLGIGVPTLVADCLPADREIILHSENGLLGMSPSPAPGAENPWLINAGKQHVTLLPGGSFFHHADSFAMIRGGHIDLCVLGAYQVAANGDLANWAVDADRAPAVGGAMDLAVGARRVWVVMDHCTRSGAPRIVERCGYPLTAAGVVSRIYTDLALIEVTASGLSVLEMIEGLDPATLQSRTEAALTFGTAQSKDGPPRRSVSEGDS